ncbi:MAG: ABC transporter ATP-binding protein, partial [Clostridia bacterium]|nr:ABC transporter ATP-binding protein [Clostridia bacterium]
MSKQQAPKGPGGRRPLNPQDLKNIGKNSKKTIKRLLGLLRPYRARLALVFLCILISAGAGILGSMFTRILIDDYITPLIGQSSPDFSGLIRAIMTMGCIYLAGMISSFTYNRLMVTVSQGTMKGVRDRLFTHMQTLSIGYFDSNTHGDLMSRYTNDTDTLQQMLSQSIPQLMNSSITIVGVLCAMLYTSPALALLTLLTVWPMMKISGFVAGNSSKYFTLQQAALGDANGYIEEMINGQKVVNVFCYEDRAKERFDTKNDALRENSSQAHKFSNILMPILGNLAHVQYVLLAIAGGVMAILGVGGMKIGVLASFLQLSKSFNMPINQLSQQLNSIVMALAGAERIFDLMDQPPEVDEGKVVLVHAVKEGDTLKETDSRTGVWAWKKPDGELVEVKGDVRLTDVDFGYIPE